MNRVWPLLVLVVLLGWQSSAVAQLTVKPKATVKLDYSDASKKKWNLYGFGRLAVFSPDGKTLAATSSDDGNGLVILWDVAKGEDKAVLRAHTGIGGGPSAVICMAFNSDGTRLAIGGLDNVIKVWDTTTRKQLAVFRPQVVTCVAFSPDGKTLASGGRSGIHLWDMTTGKERAELVGEGADTLTYSPDGRYLAGGSLWDMEMEEKVRLPVGYTNFVFTPNSKLLVTRASNDSAIHLWDTAAGKVQGGKVPTALTPLYFSPDNKVVAGPTGKGIKWIAVDSGKDVATIEEEFALLNDKPTLNFSPDGKTLTALVKTDKGFAIKTWELTWEKAPAK